MKAVLVALNAKYIHSNLGIYCLHAYCMKHGVAPEELIYREYTINQNMDDIIGDIYEEKPDFIGFSCYIWNIEEIEKITEELYKILPDTVIWLGGPEVSYDAKTVLQKNPWIRGICIGEGEESFYEVLCCYRDNQTNRLEQISGIVMQKENQKGEKKFVETKLRPCMSLDDVVFPYADMKNLQNRIVYYETSRGCPYGCSYCLSSVEKNVRFRSMELVKKELSFFLEQKVPQVKFVDRTFNCNEKHTMDIWQYIYENDNGITNFHFELSADILTEKEIEYVSHFRPGLVQFEIGVQTTNPKTIEAIHRKMNLEKLKENVAKVHQARNIHQHLDLIAGLPYEDFNHFRQSFNDVYAMQPDQLQLGFLKVLKGSLMHRQAKEFGIQYHSAPPYEVLCTNWLSYEEVRRLKGIEEVVERYYNSLQFESSLKYLVQQEKDAFLFFEKLAAFFKEHGYFGLQQSRMQNYEILYAFAKEEQRDVTILRELLIYDLYARENVKKEPDFLQNRTISVERKEMLRQFYQNEEKIEQYLPEYQQYSWKQILRMTHMEWFSYDILQYLKNGTLEKKKNVIVFDYQKRNPLSYQAKTQNVEL